MSSEPPKPKSDPPKEHPPEKRTKSGEHASVIAFREKLQSFDENTLPALDEALAKMDEIVSSIPPPSLEEEKKEEPKLPDYSEEEITKDVPSNR